jgi:hypothetical protein
MFPQGSPEQNFGAMPLSNISKILIGMLPGFAVAIGLALLARIY